MKKYYEDEYVELLYDEDSKIQIRNWKAETEKMKTEKWKEISYLGLECLEKFNITKVLNNTTNFKFLVVPELQEWYNDEIFTKWVKMKNNMVAMLVSNEMIVQLSLEQNMSEPMAKNNIVTKFFNEEVKALNWLKNF